MYSHCKRIILFPVIFLLGNLVYSLGNIPVHGSSDFIITENIVGIENHTPVPLQNNLFCLRFHHGINEVSSHFPTCEKHPSKYPLHSDESFNSSCKPCYILTSRKNLPDAICISPPCYLRAPPVSCV